MKLARYWWERTILFLEVDPATPFAADEKLYLQLIPADDSEAPEPFAVDNCARISDTVMSVRFLMGVANDPVPAGTYRALVQRNGAFTPVDVSEIGIPLLSLDNKRSDVFLYIRAECYYAAVPVDRDGELTFKVTSKAAPGHKPSAHYSNKAEIAENHRLLIHNYKAGLLISFFNFFKKTCKVNPKKILFTSDSRANLSGNMEPLYKRMRERGITDNYKIVFSFKENAVHRRSLWSLINLHFHLATSKLIFCDDYQSMLYRLNYRPEQRQIQLWHACGHFKTVGLGRIGTLAAVSPFNISHRTYTDVIVASDSDVPIYGEAFGIPDNRVKPLGIPRHDWLLNKDWQAVKKKTFQETFPNAAGKRVVVFAPTFRGEGRRTAYYDYDLLQPERLAQFCREHNLFFIFKMHPFVLQEPPIPEGCDDVFANGTPIREINDILPSTDILITDYSSVVYEASLLGIPTLYYAFDKEEYISERDFYEPYDDFVSGKIVYTFDELLDAIANEDFELERLQDFVRKNFKHIDGHACDRIIDEIILKA
ncbi:CDP-glycerol glycerophosphotransferase family protein [Slackia heliotrinireducens]|uniref:CDP-glycerol glycerophosphotransferase family protein n=1 Tax=Slackia heliotrinireducens TaxID=84110 RepID=UPI003315515D